jgi:hypothetical protein
VSNLRQDGWRDCNAHGGSLQESLAGQKMLGVEIHDMHPRGFLSFDLKEILHCLGEDATERVWRCTNLEITGDATPELEAAERADTLISGERLLALAERTNQVIWGDFSEIDRARARRASVSGHLTAVSGKSSVMKPVSRRYVPASLTFDLRPSMPANLPLHLTAPAPACTCASRWVLVGSPVPQVGGRR